MNSAQTALPLRRVGGPLELARMPAPPRMSPVDPAVSVMTDFTKTAVYCVDQDAGIDQALMYMKAVGVRFLFVNDDDDNLAGLVTSTDIQGEKPLRYLQSVDCTLTSCAHTDVLVKHVMVPVENWEVIDYSDVDKARISQILDSFKATGRRHLVVTENSGKSSIVRGIFSATRVEQALGMQLDIVRTAKSFAEIESALMR